MSEAHTHTTLRNACSHLRKLADGTADAYARGDAEALALGSADYVRGVVEGLRAAARQIEDIYLPPPKKPRRLRLVTKSE